MNLDESPRKVILNLTVHWNHLKIPIKSTATQIWVSWSEMLSEEIEFENCPGDPNYAGQVERHSIGINKKCQEIREEA